jgi:hypothetical protein
MAMLAHYTHGFVGECQAYEFIPPSPVSIAGAEAAYHGIEYLSSWLERAVAFRGHDAVYRRCDEGLMKSGFEGKPVESNHRLMYTWA